jgi:hypothetical protein
MAVDYKERIWLFGGDDHNDLWMYNPATTYWNWVAGSTAGYTSTFTKTNLVLPFSVDPLLSNRFNDDRLILRVHCLVR